MNASLYLMNEIRHSFSKMKGLGDKTIDQLSLEQLMGKTEESSNSIATLVKHMWGNMRSRWINFLEEDGEKEWREREAEFENDFTSKEQIRQLWEEGWKAVFDAIDQLNEENIDTTIYIRKEAHTITQAFLRQHAHYSYHIGQIVQLGKHWQGEKWVSLSIPKGKSDDFKDNAGEYQYNK